MTHVGMHTCCANDMTIICDNVIAIICYAICGQIVGHHFTILQISTIDKLNYN